MRLKVNLARRPFSNHRLLWIGVVLTCVISALSILATRDEKATLNDKVAEIQRRVTSREAAVDKARQDAALRKQKIVQTVSLTPDEAIQLASARLLISEKSFSWDRMIGDVEKFIPDSVKITGIRFQGLNTGVGGVTANLELGGVGKNAGDMTELMSRLEGSRGMFVVGDVMQGQMSDLGEIPFGIAVRYRPGRGDAQ